MQNTNSNTLQQNINNADVICKAIAQAFYNVQTVCAQHTAHNVAQTAHNNAQLNMLQLQSVMRCVNSGEYSGEARCIIVNNVQYSLQCAYNVYYVNNYAAKVYTNIYNYATGEDWEFDMLDYCAVVAAFA